jgi:hypothetical protein
MLPSYGKAQLPVPELPSEGTLTVGFKGRYLRMENPTGVMMEWMEWEIISDGVNIIAKKAELFTSPDFRVGRKFNGRSYVDGKKDTLDRNIYAAQFPGNRLNPWIEVDLGHEVEIEKVIFYGSRIDQKQYRDKGHRVATILDKNRQVVWCEKFDYYDFETHPTGVYAFEPTTGGNNPVIGTILPSNTSVWLPFSWVTGITEQQTPPDSDKRLAEFQDLNTLAGVKALADEFIPLLAEDIPALDKTRSLYAQGKYQAALDSWKVWWFAKMAVVDNHRNLGGGAPYTKAQADDLLKGILVNITHTTAAALRFTPGSIYWVPPVPVTSKEELTIYMKQVSSFASVNVMARPLIKAFAEDPNPEYIRQWARITDDWCLNYFRDADASSYSIKELFVMTPARHWRRFMEELSRAAVKQPSLVKEMPSTTLARTQLTCLDQYGPAYWRVVRETVFNHTTSAFSAWYSVLPYIDELKPGRRIAREWRQHLARWMTIGMEPDGSMVEIGDEGHFSIPFVIGEIINDFKTKPSLRPDWYTPGFENRAMQHYRTLALYPYRHRTPGGYDHRVRMRSGLSQLTNFMNDFYTRKGAGGFPLFDYGPTLKAIPEVKRTMRAMFGSNIAGWTEGVDPGRPKVNSDWMPYTGSYYFRGGWEKGNQFLGMIARSSRGGSHPFGFTGQYDEYKGRLYTWDYDTPLFEMRAIQIDGKPQSPFYPLTTTFLPGSKTAQLASAERFPTPYRFHTSSFFDFGEMVFEGAYQKRQVKFSLKPGSPLRGQFMSVDFNGEVVDNVRNRRQIIHLRQERLFIVIETVIPPEGSHTYNNIHSLFLTAPNAKKGEESIVKNNSVRIDSENKTISSIMGEMPGGVLRQFTSLDLNYREVNHSRFPSWWFKMWFGEGSRTLAFKNVDASWQSDRPFVIVNLYSSSPGAAGEQIKSISSQNNGKGQSGFTLELKDGTQVWCQAAVETSKLTCGPVEATAKGLVVVKRAGVTRGLTLDAENLFINRQVVTSVRDFEFTLTNGQLAGQQIYKPVSPVEFSPGINTFMDTLRVTMKSKTPTVEIRYTIDGTRPTLSSPLYTGPVVISKTTEFAARAWRLDSKGKRMPPMSGDDYEINGTRSTLPTYGWFYKREMVAAPQPAGNLRPGLLTETYHDHWTKLWTRLPWLKPDETGVSKEGLTYPETQEDYFSTVYRGYINIPTSGTYTFYAPKEFVNFDNSQSYDLRVYINDEEWDLTQWWHGRGTWSIPLEQGNHKFSVEYSDARTTKYKKSGLWRWYPLPHVIYQGPPSPIEVSGPETKQKPIPSKWFGH